MSSTLEYGRSQRVSTTKVSLLLRKSGKVLAKGDRTSLATSKNSSLITSMMLFFLTQKCVYICSKLIGARVYTFDNSARDTKGHGTHTASTAAGN